jgi:hypothetical protein
MSEASRSAPRSTAAPGRPLAIVAGVTMFFIALQFVLAGYGIFERQYHKADDGWFEPHQAVGYLTILSIIAVLVVALVTHQERGIALRAVALVVLGILQPLLAGLGGDTSPWYGVLHAAVAVAIAAIDGILIGQGIRASGRS